MQQDLREESLIYAAQQGDREAFAMLYESNAEHVYRYLLSRLRQSVDAEDVTAEVFIRALKALPSYKHQGVPFLAWLIRIAHNTAVNYVKKQARRKEIILDEAISIADDPSETAIMRLESAEVSVAMKALTDLQRQVLSLRFLKQLSITETAGKMKRSEQAVKFLQHSALRAIRRVLKSNEEGSSNAA
ncbi:MAG: sigma-70 family RNA polymerase sigma factor [Chloroflexi bacterium]|nr:sigma-70 family RNA polymerase sigma factor [Chloroflexota bacterium]